MIIAIDVLRQRFSYLIFGNAHGVSSNWLAKRNKKTFQNVIEVLSEPMLTYSIIEKLRSKVRSQGNEHLLLYQDTLLHQQ